MDPRAYRDARWLALLREAEELGVPEEQAPVLVERVLAAQRRRIGRAEDPDPVVREALQEAVLGRPAPAGRGRWVAVVAFAAVLAVVGAFVALTRPAPPPRDHLRSDQLPSLFGYDGPSAARLLQGRGLRVHLQPFRSCEVMGRVLAVDPPPGTPYDRGDEVTVYTAIPASITCLTDYQDRALAWQWIDFALGHGRAPRFADRVFVYPEPGRREVLTGSAATDATAWADSGVLAALRKAAAGVSLESDHPVVYRLPDVRVVPATEGVGTCGVPTPAVAGTADAIAVLISQADHRGCPVRVELYRDRAHRIESVALYRPSS